MECPFHTKTKKKHVCMRYSGPYYKQDCPFNGILKDCREGKGSIEPGSSEPVLKLPFE